MTKARKQRLREARVWFKSQNFTDDSHIVKAYRKQFNVDHTCAMTELCMLKVLSPEKQKAYEEQLAAKKRKRKERAERKKTVPVKTKVADFSSYDVVFIGFPVWYGTMPNFLQEYVKNAKLKDKRVIPFATVDTLGYYGAEEVSKTTWDFCDELTGMYKNLRENDLQI